VSAWNASVAYQNTSIDLEAVQMSLTTNPPQKLATSFQGNQIVSSQRVARYLRHSQRNPVVGGDGNEGEELEHYCTLFNFDYLPQGLVLHQSLCIHDPKAALWVLCMDEKVEAALRKLNLPSVRLIPLTFVESRFPQLLNIKASRKIGEYCWTLTPFLPQIVLENSPTTKRVTYLDSDLFFLSSPAPIFNEFESDGKSVLITEHNYGSDCDKTTECGRFCVQFIPFRNNAEALQILNFWQGQCLEWCFDRLEPGRYGDQLYLDIWPLKFEPFVHILRNNDLVMGPWNDRRKPTDDAVFYHMSTFRIWSNGLIRYYAGFGISREIFQGIHLKYERVFVNMLATLQLRKIEYRLPAIPRGWIYLRRRMKNTLLQKEKWGSIKLDARVNDQPQRMTSMSPESPSDAFEKAFGTRRSDVNASFA
jgi:hypothetical protein